MDNTISQKTSIETTYGAPSSKTIEAWFPKNATRVRDVTSPTKQAVARLVCFHGAGSDSSMFTGRGSARRPLFNRLMTFCTAHSIEILAVHFPGRTFRLFEPRITSMSVLVKQLVSILQVLLFQPATTAGANDVPFFFAGHSLGAICAYEVACAFRQQQLPLPKHLILSCMVPPDTAPDERPWAPAFRLTSLQLQTECRQWNINTAVFEPTLWSMYEPILRDDFHLLDSYRFDSTPHSSSAESSSRCPSTSCPSSPGESQLEAMQPTNGSLHPAAVPPGFHAPLQIPATLFYASGDLRITKDWVQKWRHILWGAETQLYDGKKKNLKSEEWRVVEIIGTHNFFYEPKGREQWMAETEQILLACIPELQQKLSLSKQ